MQISAANLVIASQQGAVPAARPDGAFAAVLAQEKPDFEPLTFKQTQTQPAPAVMPSASQTSFAPIGSRVDIRV
jgi:hypothetical protein